MVGVPLPAVFSLARGDRVPPEGFDRGGALEPDAIVGIYSALSCQVVWELVVVPDDEKGTR